MIIDKISNLASYTKIVKNLDNAIEFINSNYNLPIGRHEFTGGAVISADVLSADISEKEFEAHKLFADIMLVLDGVEIMSYCNISELSISKEHDYTQDCGFFTGEGKDIVVTVPTGYFYIVMPQEGHKPCIHLNAQVKTKKYIIKCKQA